MEMNRNTFEPQTYTDLNQRVISDIANLKELALLSSIALLFIHEATGCLTDQQRDAVLSCEELIEGIPEDIEIIKMAFNYINTYILTKEGQRMYFCADSTKAAKPLVH